MSSLLVVAVDKRIYNAVYRLALFDEPAVERDVFARAAFGGIYLRAGRVCVPDIIEQDLCSVADIRRQRIAAEQIIIGDLFTFGRIERKRYDILIGAHAPEAVGLGLVYRYLFGILGIWIIYYFLIGRVYRHIDIRIPLTLELYVCRIGEIVEIDG